MALPDTSAAADFLEAVQVERPTFLEPGCGAFPAGAVARQAVVAQLDVRIALIDGRKAHLDLAGRAFVCLDLPLRVEEPGKDQAVRRLHLEDATLHADASVDAPVVGRASGRRAGRLQHSVSEKPRQARKIAHRTIVRGSAPLSFGDGLS
jgi:hypothetical protein